MNLMLDQSTAHVFVAAEVEALAHAERERLIAEAQATARDIIAEAERATGDVNGINMTGMPSFGAIDVPDQEIWSIVAFVKKLPTVSDEDFKTWTRQ